MKAIYYLSALVILFSTACSSSYQMTGRNDDVYYSDSDKLYAKKQTQVKTISAKNQTYASSSYNYYDDCNYCYTSRINRFNRPAGSVSYYSGYYTDSYWYDPYYSGSSINSYSGNPTYYYYNTPCTTCNPCNTCGYYNNTYSYYPTTYYYYPSYYNNSYYSGYGSSYAGCPTYGAGGVSNPTNYYVAPRGSVSSNVGTKPRRPSPTIIYTKTNEPSNIRGVTQLGDNQIADNTDGRSTVSGTQSNGSRTNTITDQEEVRASGSMTSGGAERSVTGSGQRVSGNNGLISRSEPRNYESERTISSGSRGSTNSSQREEVRKESVRNQTSVTKSGSSRQQSIDKYNTTRYGSDYNTQSGSGNTTVRTGTTSRSQNSSIRGGSSTRSSTRDLKSYEQDRSPNSTRYSGSSKSSSKSYSTGSRSSSSGSRSSGSTYTPSKSSGSSSGVRSSGSSGSRSSGSGASKSSGSSKSTGGSRR